MKELKAALAQREKQADQMLAQIGHLDKGQIIYIILSWIDADRVDEIIAAQRKTT